MMLVRARGCRICVALDSIEGIFELEADESTAPASADRASLPIVDWAQVTGVPVSPASGPGATQVMVVRTPTGHVGLRVDACLGVRSVSFTETPPMPTRLVDHSGSPLCFLLLLDGRPHLMLEPRGLLTRLEAPAADQVHVPASPGTTLAATEPAP